MKVMGIVSTTSHQFANKQLIENSWPILLAELENLFNKANTRRKLTLLLNELGFHCIL